MSSDTRKANYDDLAAKVDRAHWDEFVSFVETGTASKAFLEYVDATPACREAVEEAFRRDLKQTAQTLQTEATCRVRTRQKRTEKWRRFVGAAAVFGLAASVALAVQLFGAYGRLETMQTSFGNQADQFAQKDQGKLIQLAKAYSQLQTAKHQAGDKSEAAKTLKEVQARVFELLQQSPDGLANLLKSPDPDVWQGAILCLGKTGTPQAARLILAAMPDRKQDPQGYHTAIGAVSAIGKPAYRVLIDNSNSDDQDIRWGIVHSFAALDKDGIRGNEALGALKLIAEEQTTLGTFAGQVYRKMQAASLKMAAPP